MDREDKVGKEKTVVNLGVLLLECVWFVKYVPLVPYLYISPAY